MEGQESWDLEIKPKSRLFDFNFQDVWRYRDLLFLFVRRDFVAQYKQTILGPIWHFIQPLLTSLMFLIVFSRIAGIPTDGIPPILFYMSGVTLWNYFAICLTNTSATFIANASIFGKVYFPRVIMPLSIVTSNLIRFGIQFLLLLTMIIWYHFHGYPFQITLNLLLIPVLVLFMAGIGFGLGIIISSLTTKYRDLTVLLTFAVQLYMYATPIVYPMSLLASTRYGAVIKLNPLTPIIEGFRYSLFGNGMLHTIDVLYSGGVMLILIFIGLVIFNRVEKTFMDTV